MNKVYRVIYNKSTNQTMVVSEITKSHTKSGSSLTDKRSGNVSGCLKSMDFKKSAIIVAMVSLFTPLSVFAATPDGVATPAGLVTTGNPSVQLGSESGVTGNATNHPSVANGGNEVKDKTSSVWGTKNSSNGSYSTVWGQGNTATGTNATAFGSGSTASGTNSTAYGLGSTASGSNTTAWGSGYAGAVQSTDTVNYTISSDNYPVDENGNRPTFTITETVTGNGANATAWGGGRAIGPNATAMAKGKAYGSSSLAVGNGAIAYGANSIAFGQGKAIGTDSIAFGRSTALGANSFANGSSKTIAIGSNSVAYGESTIAKGANSMTWGYGTKATTYNATAFGKWTVAGGERATAFGMQTQALGENSVAAGGEKNVIQSGANNAAALGGQNAVVSGLNSVTLGGDGSQALASNSLAAVGGVVSAGAENAIAMGDKANATLKDSVALGSGSTTAAGVPVESAGKIGGATYTNHTWSNKLADADTNKVVSVGNRQIQHVANGQVSASSTDAINGSQLYAAYQDLQWKASVDSGGGTVKNAVSSQVIGDYTDSLNKGVVNFKAGTGIEIETANNGSLDMTFKVDKAEKHTAPNGKIVAGSPADKYWDNVQVTNAINDSGWTITNSGELINPGDSVTFTGENGINVTAAGSNVKIKFDKQIPNYEAGNNISFQNVTDNEGNITSTKINARDTTIQAASGNQHLTVSGGKLNDAGVREYTIQSNIKGDNKNISVANDGTISFTDTHSWVASDGLNKTTVNKDKEVVWQGSGSLKVENSDGTFTVSDKTAYTSEVNGLGLAKTGDEVKLTGVLPTSKVQAGSNIVSVDTSSNATTGVTTYTVNATGVEHASGNKYIKVTGGDKENFVVNEDGLDDAIKAAKSEVVAGKGGVSVDPVSRNADGANVYTVNAIDTQINPTGEYTSVTGGEVDANGVRQYTVSAKTTALTTENGKVKTPSGSDLVTADNMANTLNNLYWTAEATEKANVKAGDTVKFQGEKGIAVSNSGQTFTITNNAQYESKVAGLTLTKDDTTGDVKLTGNVGDLVDGLEPLKFAGDSGDTLQPKFGDTVKIVGDAQNINVLGKDGQLNVGLNKDVVLGDDSDSGSLNVKGDAGSTAINPNEITFSKNGNINNVATHINPDGTKLSGSNHQAASVQDVLNSGWRIKVGNADAEYVKHNEQVAFVDGKGTSVSGSKAGVAYHINTDPTSQLTINSNNQLTLNTGASSVDAGKAKAKDADSQKIATVGDMVNTINNTYWTATDGQNNTQVKAGDTLTWKGSGSLKVENENGTFTISDKTTYESKVDGLGLAKDGDIVKLTGTLPKDTNTVTAVTTTDSNLKVTPKIDGENREYDIALNKNLDLSDSGSLKTGNTLINNDGVTAKNITGDTVNATTLHAGDGNVFNVSGSTATYNTTVSGNNGKEVANVDYVNKVQTVVEQGKNTVVTENKNSNGGMTYTIDAYDTKVKAGNGLKLTQNGDTADSNNIRTYELALSDENQNAINNAMSGLTTAVDGTTAQTLNNSSNQANFMTGDNIQLSGNKNGITIATKKDVKFDSVETGNLKANNTETGSLKADTANIGTGNISTLNAGNHFSVAGDTATYNTTVSGNDGKEVANVAYVQKALPTVKAGTNIVSVDETSEDGHKVYTVNAVGVVEQAGGNKYVKVSGGGKNDFVIDDSALDTAITSISVKASPVQYSNANSPTIPNGGIKSNDVTLVGADSMQPVTIHNVASGRNPTDAVNVSQLQQATSNLGNRLNDRIDSVSQRSDASAASSIAVASMPQAYMPGKSLISAGGGTYHGQTGYAIGISTISDGGNWILKGTATGNSQKRYGAGIGVGYQW